MPLILSVWLGASLARCPVWSNRLHDRQSCIIISDCHPGESRDPLGTQVMFFVYLLASQPQGTLYVGVTSDLAQRVWQHKSKAVPGFTSKYGVDRLAWFEAHELWGSAIRREKQIKEWKRAWKIQLIKADKP